MVKNMEISYGVVPVLLSSSGAKDAQFLLIHHTVGHWGFPKGHANRDETTRDCARRELKEETGVKKVRLIDGYSYTEHYTFLRGGVETLKNVEYFLGIVENDVLHLMAPDEVQDAGWFSYEDALARLTFIESKNLLKDARDYLIAHETGIRALA